MLSQLRYWDMFLLQSTSPEEIVYAAEAVKKGVKKKTPRPRGSAAALLCIYVPTMYICSVGRL